MSSMLHLYTTNDILGTGWYKSTAVRSDRHPEGMAPLASRKPAINGGACAKHAYMRALQRLLHQDASAYFLR